MTYFTRIVALTTLTLAFIAGPALAAPDAGSKKINDDAQALIQKYQKKSKKLQQIHSQTMQNNKSLRQQQQAYRDMVQAAVKAQGYDLQAGQKRLKELAQKLQSGKLSEEKRKRLMQEFQAERRQMTQARRQAMKKPEIQQARKDLKQATLAAMKKRNPKTDDLIQSLQSIQKKLRRSMQQSG